MIQNKGQSLELFFIDGKPDGIAVFTENYAFKSPSAAAAVVNGRPTNGTTEWRLSDGKTYKAWEAEKLEQEAVA